MSIEFNLFGWDEIIQNVQGLADSSEVDHINKDVIEEASGKAEEVIRNKFPRSKDNSKSGKKGYKPGGHFIDNIPKTNIRKTKGGMYRIIGETKETGEYFYTKFPEFGTSKQPPHFAFADARQVAQEVLDSRGIEEYSKLLQEKLDGK